MGAIRAIAPMANRPRGQKVVGAMPPSEFYVNFWKHLNESIEKKMR